MYSKVKKKKKKKGQVLIQIWSTNHESTQNLISVSLGLDKNLPKVVWKSSDVSAAFFFSAKNTLADAVRESVRLSV